MKKTGFEMKYNTKNKEWIVVKVKDELTKNHRNIENIVSGVIRENKTYPMCPVLSFKTYIEQIHHEIDYMWQVPLDKINLSHPTIWYFKKKHIRKNPLSTFMSDLSRNTKIKRDHSAYQCTIFQCQHHVNLRP